MWKKSDKKDKKEIKIKLKKQIKNKGLGHNK